jgi:hypothetical protein
MELDGAYVVIYRPAPIAMDDTDYALRNGARERVLDVHAPWMYRIIHKELERHGWIDGIHTFPMEQYLYYDLHATGVDGTGDGFCHTTNGQIFVTMGYTLTAVTTDGIATTGSRMTRRFFQANPNTKRQAIALDRIRDPEEVSKLIVTVHDGDGIFLRGLGQAFMVRPEGDNAARIVPVIPREKPIDAYVDELYAGCVDGEVSLDGTTYPCVGKTFEWLTE